MSAPGVYTKDQLLNNYIRQCEETLKQFENLEEYEDCAELFEFINVLKTRNKERYIELSFDLKELTKIGFFGKNAKVPKPLEAEERIKKYFGLKEIFDYSAIGEGRFCVFKDHLRKLEAAL